MNNLSLSFLDERVEIGVKPQTYKQTNTQTKQQKR